MRKNGDLRFTATWSSNSSGVESTTEPRVVRPAALTRQSTRPYSSIVAVTEARACSTPELFDDHVAVNLKSPFFLMQAVIHDMQRRGEPGTIVNVITMTSYGGQPYLAPYAASKAGLVGLTKNAAHAHRWDRIRVNGVNIGWTDTEGEDAIQRRFHGAGDDWRELAGKSLPMGRLGQADDIAALVVLLLSERSGVVTGSIVDWDQEVLGARD